MQQGERGEQLQRVDKKQGKYARVLDKVLLAYLAYNLRQTVPAN